jgi:hypothetical protein
MDHGQDERRGGMKIASKLYSLAEIVTESPHWHFNIPIYQRLYVWGEDQVLTLLNDLVNAYEHDEDLFFLGGSTRRNSASSTIGGTSSISMN